VQILVVVAELLLRRLGEIDLAGGDIDAAPSAPTSSR
jgi:hypothetical protein